MIGYLLILAAVAYTAYQIGYGRALDWVGELKDERMEPPPAELPELTALRAAAIVQCGYWAAQIQMAHTMNDIALQNAAQRLRAEEYAREMARMDAERDRLVRDRILSCEP